MYESDYIHFCLWSFYICRFQANKQIIMKCGVNYALLLRLLTFLPNTVIIDDHLRLFNRDKVVIVHTVSFGENRSKQSESKSNNYYCQQRLSEVKRFYFAYHICFEFSNNNICNLVSYKEKIARKYCLLNV